MIVGIDYSLTSPAITIHYGTEWNCNNINHYCIANNNNQRQRWSTIQNVNVSLYPKYNDNLERYEALAEWVIDNVVTPFKRPDFVVLEDYAYAATGRVFNIAENVAILKYKLKKWGIKYHLVAPTVIKKFATDKGNANKELMYENFCKETKTNINLTLSPKSDKIGNPTSDIVDSYYICKYGQKNLTFS